MTELETCSVRLFVPSCIIASSCDRQPSQLSRITRSPPSHTGRQIGAASSASRLGGAVETPPVLHGLEVELVTQETQAAQQIATTSVAAESGFRGIRGSSSDEPNRGRRPGAGPRDQWVISGSCAGEAQFCPGFCGCSLPVSLN